MLLFHETKLPLPHRCCLPMARGAQPNLPDGFYKSSARVGAACQSCRTAWAGTDTRTPRCSAALSKAGVVLRENTHAALGKCSVLLIQIVPFHTQMFPLSLMDPSFEDVLKHYKQLQTPESFMFAGILSNSCSQNHRWSNY